MREQLARLFPRARSVPRPAKLVPSRLIILLERYVPRRIGAISTVLMLLASAILGVVKGNHVDEVIAALSDARNAAANSVGFRIASVTINGRKQLTQDEILAVGGVNGRSSLLFLDAAVVRDKLRANPWIADATVLKLYPDRLQIDVAERSAFALWQQDGRLSVICRRWRHSRTLCQPALHVAAAGGGQGRGRPARAISWHCSIVIRRSATSPRPRSWSANGAGICA